MPLATLSRRGFAGLAATWTASMMQPAVAATSQFIYETDVWTGSVLQDQTGRGFVLGDLEQPITLLKLWANWCPACAAEMPQLKAMASTMGSNMGIVLISHPQYWAADQAFARQRGLPFKLATFAPSTPAAILDQALLGPGGVYWVPKSLVFRKRDASIVLKRDSSTDWGSATMINQVRTLVG